MRSRPLIEPNAAINLVHVGLLLVTLARCDSKQARRDEANASSTVLAKPTWVRLPQGEAPTAFVTAELAKASTSGAKVLLYVGAPWCEPCTRFHDAVMGGSFDRELAGVRFLEFDHDRDEAAIRHLGCQSKLIPLFSVPAATGDCTPRRVEGGTQGEGSELRLLPQVVELLK